MVANVLEHHYNTFMAQSAEHCTCCDRKLNPKTVVYLEMNWKTGRYAHPDTEVLPGDSQGSFPFGAACARAVLKRGGVLHQVTK